MSTRFDTRQSENRAALPMVGSAANAQLNTILALIDPELSKLFEDRNILLTQGGLITYTGTQVQFTEALKLEINSQVAGGAPTIIDLGSTTRNFSATGRMLYAVIDRSLGTATVTDDATTLPSVVAANQEVFLIAKRVDDADGTARLYFRNGFSMAANTVYRLGHMITPFAAGATDNSAGSDVTIAAINSGVVGLTNASLVSISGIPAGRSGQYLIVENLTGVTVTVNNESVAATGSDRITTGTGANVSLNDRASLFLVYNSTEARWMVIGGTGSGSGGSEINFLTLNTLWQPVNTNNYNFAASLGNWVTFADAAATTPTDLTGGTANITLTRTTTAGEVLNGTGSAKITKDAANRQGEGVSCTFNVPPAYQGKVCSINIPFRTTGTIVSGDIGVWIYDVTNSVLITPFNNTLIGASGTLVCTFPTSPSAGTPANQEYRIGIYFASTSAEAVTILFDDVYVGPQSVAYGEFTDLSYLEFRGSTSMGATSTAIVKYATQAITQGTGFSVTDTPNLGTVITVLKAGTLSAQVTFFNSGAQENFSITKNQTTLTSATPVAGEFVASGRNAANGTADSISWVGPVAVGDVIRVSASGAPSASAYNIFTLRLEAPINSPLTSASTFHMSPILANGTRVSGTSPTKIGEYRTMIKASGATSFTDTDGSAQISAANGFRLFGTNGTGAGTSGQPNRIEMFIGVGKNWALKCWANPGRTGGADAQHLFDPDNSIEYGLIVQELSPGLIAVTLPIQSNNTTSRYPAVQSLSSGYTTLTSVYCELIVSEPAIPVQVGNVRSMVRLSGGNGMGSTGTKIRRYANVVENIGDAITYTDSATNGASFTINEDGVYAMSAADTVSSAVDIVFGFSVDTSALTTNIDSLPAANILIAAFTRAIAGGQGTIAPVSTTAFLRKGQVVRVHFSTNAPNASPGVTSSFTITKVSD